MPRAEHGFQLGAAACSALLCGHPPPPPVLFTFIGSSKEQVQPHPSPPGTHKEQRWILQSATCCPVLWRTRALLLSSKNK